MSTTTEAPKHEDKCIVTDLNRDWGRRPPVPDLRPSARQTSLEEDACEKPGIFVSEDTGLRASMVTLQRQLRRRDAQTSELHRQLRGLEEAHWNQTLEARHAAKQLQDLLADPAAAPQLQALELKRLRQEAEDLSKRLADARVREAHLEETATRQKAFLRQTEHFQRAGPMSLRRHPAGELFLVPFPLEGQCDEEDDSFALSRPWDVGSSHINPYPIDSWPAEPNTLAARCAADPGLPGWAEEDSADVSDGEDGSQGEGDEQAIASRLRLPAEAAEESPPEPPVAFRSARSV